METLRLLLNSLPTDAQYHFARRAGTTIGYLRKKLSTGGNLGAEICIGIERESRHLIYPVRCEDLRPDIDWSFIRATARRRKAA